MKLSSLFTEDSSLNSPKNLQQVAIKAFGRIKSIPNPREARIKMIIRQIFQDTWAKYHTDVQARARITSFKNSIVQYMPRFMAMRDEKELKREIEALFQMRAEGMPFKARQDPTS